LAHTKIGPIALNQSALIALVYCWLALKYDADGNLPALSAAIAQGAINYIGASG
jgi:hypothetical protein